MNSVQYFQFLNYQDYDSWETEYYIRKFVVEFFKYNETIVDIIIPSLDDHYFDLEMKIKNPFFQMDVSVKSFYLLPSCQVVIYFTFYEPFQYEDLFCHEFQLYYQDKINQYNNPEKQIIQQEKNELKSKC
jgi:hypothetical protein